MIYKKYEILLNSIAPLFLGVIIYIGFRPTGLIYFKWFDTIGLSGFAFSLRRILSPFAGFIPDWFVFSFPDGLWAYSFIYSINLIWGRKNKWGLFWIIVSSSAVIIFELLQQFKIIHGTFDFQDLVFISLGILLSIIIKSKTSHETVT